MWRRGARSDAACHSPRRPARSCDTRSAPPALGGNETRNHTRLAIELRKQVLKVGQAGFDLDDEQSPVVGSPSENVDRASIAVVVERELGCHLPSGSSQGGDCDFDQSRVARIDEAIEIAGAPLRCQRNSDLERLGDLSNQAQGIHPTALQLRDGLLADTRQSSKVALPEAALMANGAHDRTESEVVHGGKIRLSRSTRTYRTPTVRRPGGRPPRRRRLDLGQAAVQLAVGAGEF